MTITAAAADSAIPRDAGGQSAISARTRRVFLLTLLASILVETAWMLAVPPFVGMDENQHATKAAAVARGDWNPRHRLAGAYGGVVQAPASLVEAARPECEGRNTTDRFNCQPITHLGNDMVTVTSLAASYNPLFYAVVGTAGRPFTGIGSLYAMRACAGLLCAIMIALASAIVSRWATTRTPLVALQIGAVPVLWYSTSILAPNGLEMCCGLAVWSALLGVVRSHGHPDRMTIVVGTTAACVMSLIRGAGPFWLTLILFAIFVMAPSSTTRQVFRSKWARWSGLAVALSIVGAGAWTLASWTSVPPPPAPHPGSPIAATITGLPLWAIGSYAVYPGPWETAPIAVYMIGIVVWGAFLGSALLRARRAIWVSTGFVALVSALIPVVLTMATYHRIGLFWQGRYALPFVVGISLMLGYALDERCVRVPIWLSAPVLAGSSLAILISLTAIVHNYLPYRSTLQGWFVPSGVMLTILIFASAGLSLLVIRQGSNVLIDGNSASDRVSRRTTAVGREHHVSDDARLSTVPNDP